MFDLAIVGSGPSAAAAYAAFIERAPNSRVVLLEGGGDRSSYRGSFAVDPGHGFRLAPTTYLGKGGTSELWHYVLAPLDPIDFEPREFVGSPGWPISYEDLKPYYRKALKFLGVQDSGLFERPVDLNTLRNQNLEGLYEQFEPKLFIQLKRRWRAAEFWKRANVRVIYNHFVRQLESNDKCVFIRSANQNDKANPVVSARRVIVACGGINSPQIIYSSTTDDRARANIGRNLFDHPMGVGMQIRRQQRYNFDILTSQKTADYNRKIAIRLTDTVQRAEGLPNSSFYFRPSFSEGSSDQTEALKAKILTYRDALKRLRVPLGLTLDIMREWNLVRQIISYKTGLMSNVDLFDIFCVTEQSAGASHMTFSCDDDGHYTGACHWQVTPKDAALNNRILGKIEQWVKQYERGGYVSAKSQNIEWTKRATSAAHHVGTLAMAQSSESGVVNTQCALFGSGERIFVADASVAPTPGCANITLTSMALAKRVGSHVAGIV